MHLVYVDGSGDAQLSIFSALMIPAEEWRNAFQQVKNFRQDLKRTEGILVQKELHAVKFATGRGRPAGTRIVSKYDRSEIFRATLTLTASLPGVRLINACFPQGQDEVAFERLLNRVQRAMEVWNSNALIVSDEGKEAVYTRLARRMGVFNPIPSRYGVWWDTGTTTRNIPTLRIVEDIVFKDSRRSYFIQLVDFCAYALLRRENPVASRTRYGLDKAFELLSPILHREAAARDPDGILRDRYVRPGEPGRSKAGPTSASMGGVGPAPQSYRDGVVRQEPSPTT